MTLTPRIKRRTYREKIQVVYRAKGIRKASDLAIILDAGGQWKSIIKNSKTK